MEIDREAILQTFFIESDEHLCAMEEALIALENRPEDEELLQTVFRVAHTLKGSASCLGLQSITRFTHVLEDLLERLRNRAIPVTSKLVTLLLQTVDALRQMVPEAMAGIEEMQPPHKALLRRLAKRLPAAVSKDQGSSHNSPAVELKESLRRKQEDIQASADHVKTLRVDIEKLDRMLTLTGEVAIARGRLRLMIERLGSRIGEEIIETHLETDRLFAELQELIMKVRMVPVGPTFRRYNRTVRDVATSHGKLARLHIEGDDVEVDTRVIEHLRDPLTHTIRNALDHGLEPPDVREAKGKDPCGCVSLRAAYDSGAIVIRVTDDGAGLNRERITQRAKSLGIVTEPERMTDQDVMRLVLEPGFSTAETVTDLSGRGFGMDVVRRNIEALRGSVEIENRDGEGTTITMRLPLTLAIIDGLGVGVGSETHLIPMETVIECLELPDEERDPARLSGVIDLRGQPLPYLRLRNFFAIGGAVPQREHVVVVQHAGSKAGLVVDTLHGESQAVIKPLGKLFRGLPSILGSTILGSGRVALILDVPEILRHAAERQMQMV
ncbi:MAG TPA: chemotaxis protein CheA [Blastocatellia bacterium]|nr:chemotaxis protein CheA [Blastocatellia bacterium]